MEGRFRAYSESYTLRLCGCALGSGLCWSCKAIGKYSQGEQRKAATTYIYCRIFPHSPSLVFLLAGIQYDSLAFVCIGSHESCVTNDTCPIS